MLVTDPEILLTYVSTSKTHATLDLSNPNPLELISFKIKTTKPAIFSVIPTKGFLIPGKNKTVEIGLIGQHSKEQVDDIVSKEKFLIEYIPMSEKVKQEEMELEWKQAFKEDAIKKIKLKMKMKNGDQKKAADMIFEDQGAKKDEPMFSAAYNVQPDENTMKRSPQSQPIDQSAETSQLQVVRNVPVRYNANRKTIATLVAAAMMIMFIYSNRMFSKESAITIDSE